MRDFEWFVRNGPCKKYCAGQTIPFCTEEEFPRRAMYLLLNGKIEVLSAGKCTAAVSPGEPFGGYEFFFGEDDKTYCAAVDSIVYIITEASFYVLARAQPAVLLDILRAAYGGSGNGHAAADGHIGVLEPESDSVKADEVSDAGEVTAAEPAAAKPQIEKTPKTPVRQPNAPPTVSEGGIFPDGHKGYPGITKPEHAPLIFKKEYICLFCKKKFTDFRVSRSKLYQSQSMRFDMRRYYKDFDPMWYDVITCPHCYFSAMYTYYAEAKPLLKAKIEEEIMAARSCVLMDFEAERDIDFVFTSHYLALICASGYIPTARQLRARLWGNLSWLYEDVGDADMERFAAGEAASAYETLYSETPLTPSQEQVTCLTIAGMMYRSGNAESIKKCLFTAKTIKGGDRAYVKMAEDMIDMLRDEGK